MGTDIHAVFMRRKTPLKLTDETKTPFSDSTALVPNTNQEVLPPFNFGTRDDWEEVQCSWDQWRNYLLFAFLADVRNGFGFAGVITHQEVVPIAERRGVPGIFEYDPEYGTGGDEVFGKWIGDHSYTWLTLDEILHWRKNKMPKYILRAGYVDRDFFNTWDGVSSPDSWSGGVSGPGIKCVNWDGTTLPSRMVGTDQPREPGKNVALPLSEKDETTDDWTHVRIWWNSPVEESLESFFEGIDDLKARYPNDEIMMVCGFDS